MRVTCVVRVQNFQHQRIVRLTCPGQKLWCSVHRRCGICGVCHGPLLSSCQWGQMGVCCSRGVCRHVHTQISLDALGIVEGEGVAVGLVGEVDIMDGLAWMGRNR